MDERPLTEHRFGCKGKVGKCKTCGAYCARCSCDCGGPAKWKASRRRGRPRIPIEQRRKSVSKKSTLSQLCDVLNVRRVISRSADATFDDLQHTVHGTAAKNVSAFVVECISKICALVLPGDAEALEAAVSLKLGEKHRQAHSASST